MEFHINFDDERDVIAIVKDIYGQMNIGKLSSMSIYVKKGSKIPIYTLRFDDLTEDELYAIVKACIKRLAELIN